MIRAFGGYKIKTLIDENRLQTRIGDMAWEISRYYGKQEWYRNTQESVVVVGILTGAMFFMADLVRKLSIRVELDFIRITTTSAIIVPPLKRLNNGPNVLLVDDILDTDKTIRTAKDFLSWPCAVNCFQSVENIKTAVLLRKLLSTPVDTTADFVGFDVPDKFIYGYGLDDNGRHRELPYVAVRS